MIVKDENAVICRCLESIRNIIDYWVIVDTGSTDGTQKTIQNFLQNIPGELHERVWVNFAHNRNIALNLARNKADYILFADADDRFVISDALFQARLSRDYYLVFLSDGHVSYYRILMINNGSGWIWEGVIHEYITTAATVTGEILGGIMCDVSANDGHRSTDPAKCLKDAKFIEQELQKNPADSRLVFYLAQSYRAAGDLRQALKYFEMRASMPSGNMPEENFWSLYFVGCLQQELKMPPEVFISSYCRAYLSLPSRAEPLYRLAFYFNQNRNYLLGYLLGMIAIKIPIPAFYVAIERAVYDQGVAFEFARSAYHLGYFGEPMP
jgi:glycosyltransferase involved in cell wall biosynthesis